LKFKALKFYFVLFEPFCGQIIFDGSQIQIGAVAQNVVLNSIASLRGSGMRCIFVEIPARDQL